jgi:DNA primase
MYKENSINLFSYIKERVTILQVIGESIELKKAGFYYKGCCPFHSEKTASFTVSPHREIFYCFGCHAGGDVITFLAKLENCQPFEAAQLLIDRYGIAIPESVIIPVQISTDEKKRYFRLSEIVALWCHENLSKFPSSKGYCQKRNISDAAQNNFMVGFFPEGEKAIKGLIEYIKKESYFSKDLIDAGICGEAQGRLYSPFENRIIFPIKDTLGRFCGFGGRVFKEGDERAKYYNSRENSYFHKGSLLFGFDQAKRTIQKEGVLFLVEGYTDCIAMVQAGYHNTVATLGTACTLDHLKIVSHYAKKIYIMYDGDAAGQQAMLRFVQFCWQVSLEVLVITLPAGEDPASFLQNNKSLTSLVEQAQDIFTLFIETKCRGVANKTLQEKLEATREVLQVIYTIEDQLKKDFLLQKAASILGVSSNVLISELAKIEEKKASYFPTQQSENKVVDRKNILSGIEKKFFSSIFNDLGRLDLLEVKNLLEYFPETVQTIIKKLQLVKHEEEKKRFIYFFDMLEEDEKEILQEIVVDQDVSNEIEFEQLVMLLEKKYWKLIVARTKVTIEKAQEAHDSETVEKVMAFFLNIKKKLLHRGLI